MLNQFFYKNLKEVLFYLDFQGKIKSLSPYWEELTGYSLQESVNQSFRDFIFNKDYRIFDHLISSVFLGEQVSSNIILIHKNGFKKNVSLIVGIPDPKMRVIPAIINDITLEVNFDTSIKEIEKRADELSKTKAGFFAMLSHEIRTPMNGIIGMLEILLRGNLSEEQTEFIETIKSSSEDLLS